MMSTEVAKPGGAGPQDKDVEMAINAISTKVDDVKGSLSTFVGKMEQETLTWPSALDSFAALSGQFSTLMKQLNNDKVPPLFRQVLLPQHVSSDKDADLERATEGRVPVLHHEIVPNYLRTKLDLDLESRQRELYSEAASPSPGFDNELKRYNQLLDNVIGLVEEASEDREKQSNKVDSIQPTTLDETKKLAAAYLNCTGLQPISNYRRAALMGRPAVPQQMTHPQQQPMVRTQGTLSRVAPPTRPIHSSQPQMVPHPQAAYSTPLYKK